MLPREFQAGQNQLGGGDDANNGYEADGKLIFRRLCDLLAPPERVDQIQDLRHRLTPTREAVVAASLGL
jgi:hypothetical protein